jgi:hypothetical protein
MSDDERERIMNFIVERQERIASQQERFTEQQAQSEHRIGRLERVMKLAIRAGWRERRETRRSIDALITAQLHTDDAMARMADAQAKLAESQGHTDRRLDALIDVVKEGRGNNGNSGA